MVYALFVAFVLVLTGGYSVVFTERCQHWQTRLFCCPPFVEWQKRYLLSRTNYWNTKMTGVMAVFMGGSLAVLAVRDWFHW